MADSIASRNVEFSDDLASIEAPAMAEAEYLDDLFHRHLGIPGHDQRRLSEARIACVGAGGLNSWVALGLLRSGAGALTIIDHDEVESSNLPRQFYRSEDAGEPKAPCLIRNLAAHAVGGALLTAISRPFEEAIDTYSVPADILVCGVDNNPCRLACAKEARRRGIPAVFSMLSEDGMRGHCFLQGPRSGDACLLCALPNLDPESSAPCVSAIVTSCLLMAGYTLYFVHRAIMGWSADVEPFNWREFDLQGIAPDRMGRVARRHGCCLCNG